LAFIHPLKKILGGLFIDGDAGYAYSKVKSTDTKVHEFVVGFRPGVAINVSLRVLLIGKSGCIGYQYKKSGDRKINSIDFNISQIQLGIISCFKFQFL